MTSRAGVVHTTARRAAVAGAAVWLSAFFAATVAAAPIDDNGDIRLGVRIYSAARVGTEDTDKRISHGLRVPTVDNPDNRSNRVTHRSLTFPESESWSLRQQRNFAEVDWNHDLDRLILKGFGPFSLLRHLPFDVRRVSYRVTYRGEHEGLYDYGPDEYRTAEQFNDSELVPPNPLVPGGPVAVDIVPARRRLREIAVQRHRLFQAYMQAKVGDLFLRVGRQILVWGETDAFRLLDNINPLDTSFGGFLVPLDERRVPLDMVVARYELGRFSALPVSDLSLEAYAAIDDSVSFDPGIPQGSPWNLPNLGAPSALVVTERDAPARTFSDMRGGARLSFAADLPWVQTANFSLAHYYTYVDLPAVQMSTRSDSQSFPVPIPDGKQGAGASALIVQSAPLVQITGASTTFAIPPEWVQPIGLSGEPIVRAEVAYFQNEPRYRQSDLDPFYFALPLVNTSNGTLTPCPNGEITADGYCRAPRRTGDSWNVMLGTDMQQWIRLLNPNASFFISTQIFYKHLLGAAKRKPLNTPGKPFAQQCGAPGVPSNVPCFAESIPQPMDGEVLPVPELLTGADYYNLPVDATAPQYVRTSSDQILHTLFIGTSYASGQINPTFGLFYDWQGAIVVQPQVTFQRDPFRFIVNYNLLAAGRLRGGSGISLLRDRDNLLFQVEYAL